jgi:hypothetical protein
MRDLAAVWQPLKLSTASSNREGVKQVDELGDGYPSTTAVNLVQPVMTVSRVSLSLAFA